MQNYLLTTRERASAQQFTRLALVSNLIQIVPEPDLTEAIESAIRFLRKEGLSSVWQNLQLEIQPGLLGAITILGSHPNPKDNVILQAFTGIVQSIRFEISKIEQNTSDIRMSGNEVATIIDHEAGTTLIEILSATQEPITQLEMIEVIKTVFSTKLKLNGIIVEHTPQAENLLKIYITSIFIILRCCNLTN